MLTLESVQNHPEVQAFMARADANLAALGYTEHGIRHARIVSSISRNILERLGFPERTAVLASIAGYMHDLGNAINRNGHGLASAFLSYQMLRDLNATPDELALITSASANHDENEGGPVNDVSAAVIIADKSDVHRSRVRTTKQIDFDIHDRVNYAVRKSRIIVNRPKKTITLVITIDTNISKVMEYFEIFLTRMMASQKAAKVLGCEFKLLINKTGFL
ncbi:MAG: HD domain-containing protein [Planctomycetes bacterium]|nr:HD domain-containing protein [Planctomycetota bacterium]